MRTWEGPGALERKRILDEARVVAVVGASDDPSRASYFVTTYLQASTGYTVRLVNPRLDSVLGLPCYPSLADLPERPDVVDVFRRPSELAGVAAQSREVGAPVLWLQLGLWDEAVAREAEAAGQTVVMDRCLKIEHARFAGGLHLAGFDTGVVDSRRRARG
ncbi:CoA-binding protein [Rhodococcus aerolatus]